MKAAKEQKTTRNNKDNIDQTQTLPAKPAMVSPDGKQKKRDENAINALDVKLAAKTDEVQLKPIVGVPPTQEDVLLPAPPMATAKPSNPPIADDDISSVESGDSGFFRVLRNITKNGSVDILTSPPKKTNVGVHCEVHVEHLRGNLMLVTCCDSSNNRDPFIRQGTKAVEQGMEPFDKYCCFPVILSDGPNTEEGKKNGRGYNLEGMLLFKGLTKKESEKTAAKFVMDYKLFLEGHGFSNSKGLHEIPEAEKWSFYDLKDEEMGIPFDDDTPTTAEGGKRKLGDVVVERNAVDICLKIAQILDKNPKNIHGQKQFTTNYFNPPYGRIARQRLGLGMAE